MASYKVLFDFFLLLSKWKKEGEYLCKGWVHYTQPIFFFFSAPIPLHLKIESGNAFPYLDSLYVNIAYLIITMHRYLFFL